MRCYRHCRFGSQGHSLNLLSQSMAHPDGPCGSSYAPCWACNCYAPVHLQQSNKPKHNSCSGMPGCRSNNALHDQIPHLSVYCKNSYCLKYSELSVPQRPCLAPRGIMVCMLQQVPYSTKQAPTSCRHRYPKRSTLCSDVTAPDCAYTRARLAAPRTLLYTPSCYPEGQGPHRPSPPPLALAPPHVRPPFVQQLHR